MESRAWQANILAIGDRDVKALPPPPRRLDNGPTRRDNPARRELLVILLIGLLSGALYLLIYLAQRALYHMTFDGIHLRGIAIDRAPLLGECAIYYGATIALFALYAQLLALCRRGYLRDPRVCSLALAFPVLFNLGLLFGRPYLSIDLYSYIAGGYLGSTPGNSPYVQPISSVADTPFGALLVAVGWRPEYGVQPYGPLWIQCEATALRLTHDVPTTILLLKGLVIAASLGSAALIWSILGRVRPADRLLGTLLYLWNPVIIVEFAAEGHNDALMILCVLAALLLAVGARPALALAALLLGALAKYVPLVLFPALAGYFRFSSHIRRDWARLVALLLLGLLAGLGLAALFYGPSSIGAAPLRALRTQGAPHISASITGGLYEALLHSPLRAVAGPLTSGLLGGIFTACALLVSWRVRDTAGLLRACACISLVYVLVASPYYFPWYTTFPLALLALAPRGCFLRLALALTCGARLVAPLAYLRDQGLITQPVKFAITTTIAIALPLLTFLLLTVSEWLRKRRLVDGRRG